MIFSDKKLSQKIERAEALSNVDFVDTRVKMFPKCDSEWIEVAGVYVMFDGADSPTTQTFGLGLFDEITDVEIDEIEDFFRQRNSPMIYEVSPLADVSLLNLLNKRGYQPIEMSSVLYRPLDSENEIVLPKNPHISTRIINADKVDIFARTSMAGWIEEMPEFESFGLELCKVGASCKGAKPFIAEIDGKPIATGTIYIYDDVALFAGASTIPEARRQGAQTALLEARLRYASENGCTIAVMSAMPGSQSQKNAEKNGFQIAYTRTKWQKNYGE